MFCNGTTDEVEVAMMLIYAESFLITLENMMRQSRIQLWKYLGHAY